MQYGVEVTRKELTLRRIQAEETEAEDGEGEESEASDDDARDSEVEDVDVKHEVLTLRPKAWQSSVVLLSETDTPSIQVQRNRR